MPELDALIEAVEAEQDTEKMGKRMAEVARFVRANHIYVPIAEVGVEYAANPKKIPSWNVGKLLYDLNLPDLVRQK